MENNERYIHYRESLTCLNRAWRTLCELEKTEPKGAIWAAAYRMSIVEYGKPFKVSRSQKHRYKLEVPQIEAEYIELHEIVIDLRDQVVAHSDLTVLDASLSYGGSHEPCLIMNNIDSFPEAKKLRKLIERVLDQLYLQEPDYLPNANNES